MIITSPIDPSYLAPVSQQLGIPLDGTPADLVAQYLEGVDQNEVEPIGFTRISFIAPGPLSIVVRQRNDEFIDVDFGSAMKDDAALIDPASYALTPAGGIGVPVSVSGVARLSPTTIRLTVTLGTNGQPYQLSIVGDVRQITGESIVGTSVQYLAEVIPPLVLSARALSSNVVEVTFSRAMENNADLLDPTKYRFTDGLFAATVVRTGATTVEVTTSAQVEGVNYSLRVFP